MFGAFVKVSRKFEDISWNFLKNWGIIWKFSVKSQEENLNI